MLGLAVFLGQFECAALLLGTGPKVDVASSNSMRVAPMHAAAAQADQQLAVRLMCLLLAFGADPNAKQRAGWTALHSAAHRDYADLLTPLISAGADPELRNDDCRSALGLALAQIKYRAIAALSK